MVQLEDDLRYELRVARFAWTKSRRPIEVANGVAYESATSTHRSGAGSKINPVTDVIDLSAKLEFDPFRDCEVFEDGEIKVLEAGSIVLVARKIAKR